MFIFKIGSDEVRVRTDEEFKSLNDDEKRFSKKRYPSFIGYQEWNR